METGSVRLNEDKQGGCMDILRRRSAAGTSIIFSTLLINVQANLISQVYIRDFLPT